MYFITTKRMLEVFFSAHPNIQYRTQNPTYRQNISDVLHCIRRIYFFCLQNNLENGGKSVC